MRDITRNGRGGGNTVLIYVSERERVKNTAGGWKGHTGKGKLKAVI